MEPTTPEKCRRNTDLSTLCAMLIPEPTTIFCE